jgi:predicted transcriptional regulator
LAESQEQYRVLLEQSNGNSASSEQFESLDNRVRDLEQQLETASSGNAQREEQLAQERTEHARCKEEVARLEQVCLNLENELKQEKERQRGNNYDGRIGGPEVASTEEPSLSANHSVATPLTKLTVAQVGELLAQNALSQYIEVLQTNEADGSLLDVCEEIDDLLELGITNKLHRRKLFHLIQVWKNEGVH